HPSIGTKLPEIRAMASSFDDAASKKDQDQYPPVHIDKPPRKGRPFSQPRRLMLPAWTAKTLAKQLLAPPPPASAANPRASPPHPIDKPPRKRRPFSQPRRLMLPAATAKPLAKQLLAPPQPASEAHPQASIPHLDAKWWRLSAYDSALVSNAEGTQVSWYKRD